MTADESALLEAIHTDPLDPAPALAYADWLEEHGQEKYAELIHHIHTAILPNREISEGHGFVHESFVTQGLKRFPLCSVRDRAIRPYREQARVGGKMERIYFRAHRFWRGLPVVGLSAWTRDHMDAALRYGSSRHCIALYLSIRADYPPGREGVPTEATPAMSLPELFAHELMKRVHCVRIPANTYLGCSVPAALDALNASPYRGRVCRIEIESRDMRYLDMVRAHIGSPDDKVWVRARG